LFTAFIFELLHEGMCVVYNLPGLFGVVVVESEPLLQIAEIGLNFDIMVIGDERSLHKPRFARGARHNGYRIA